MIQNASTRVVRFERIDSTNAEARRLAAAGDRGPLWLVAEEQTAGRGRLGRDWVSEPGNLYATLLFPLAIGAEASGQLSFVAALAAHDVCSQFVKDGMVSIKWPNDILIGGAKACGILCEVVSTQPTVVALGCGLNVAHAPSDTPYPVTALARHGAAPHLPEVFRALAKQLDNRLRQWDGSRGFSATKADWQARAIGLGSQASIISSGNDRTGRFVGLADDGALLLELDSGERTAVHAGDVRFAELERLRSAAP